MMLRHQTEHVQHTRAKNAGCYTVRLHVYTYVYLGLQRQVLT